MKTKGSDSFALLGLLIGVVYLIVAALPVATVSAVENASERVAYGVVRGGNLIGKIEPTAEAFTIRLEIGQVVRLSRGDYKNIGGTNWYRCTWENNGLKGEGWISEEYLLIVELTP